MQLALDKLKEKFGELILKTASENGMEIAFVARESLVEIIRFLRDEPDLHFDMMMDLFGVDYPERKQRFEIVYQLYSMKTHKRVWIKVTTDEKTPVPTICELYKAPNWFEREVFDMFGVKFEGHPNLKRILTFEEFEGHPLRKDYPVNRRPKMPTPDTLLDELEKERKKG